MKTPIYYNKWWISKGTAITFMVVGYFPFLILRYDNFDRLPFFVCTKDLHDMLDKEGDLYCKFCGKPLIRR